MKGNTFAPPRPICAVKYVSVLSCNSVPWLSSFPTRHAIWSTCRCRTGNPLRVPVYVACQCELSRSKPTDLTECCVDLRNTQFMRVNIDSALSPANYASDCATETTCTACLMERVTSAGTLTSSSSLQSYSLGTLVKNTRVAPYVLLREYAK